MYSLKAVQSWNGAREGVAYNANLYCGTRKVGSVRQDGNGGSTFVVFSPDRSGEAAFAAWVRENCAASWISEYVTADSEDSSVAELGADMLFEWWDNDRLSRNKTLFRIPAANAWEVVVRTLNTPDSPQSRAWILQRYPTAEVWSRTLHTWETLSLEKVTV